MELSNLGPALEKGGWGTWRNQLVSWRQANIGSKLISLEGVQLPNNSVLHVADKFLALKIDTVLPDLTNPLIHNEQFTIYLENIQDIPGPTALFPVTDKYRFRPAQYYSEIRDFWVKHRAIKRATSRDAMIHRSNTLAVLNYNEILTAQIQSGTFGYYRHFDIVFRTILNTISTITGKHQWLQIPLSRTVYSNVQFTQTADKITYQTVRVKNDPSFYLLIHLLNFVNKTATVSLFSQIPTEALDTFNIILTAGDKAIIYNIGDLKEMFDQRKDNNLWKMVLRHVNTLKLAGYADLDISTLDEHAYDKLVSDVAPDDDREHQEVEPDDHHTPIEPIKTPVHDVHPKVPTSAPIKSESVPEVKSEPKIPIISGKIPVQEPQKHPSTTSHTGVDSKVVVQQIAANVEADFEEKERGDRPPSGNMTSYGIYVGSVLAGVCRINTRPKNLEDGVAISYLSVDVNHRREGLGSSLLSYICGLYPRITTTTGRRSDKQMSVLLSKAGFAAVGRLGDTTYWERVLGEAPRSEVTLHQSTISDVAKTAPLPKAPSSLVTAIDHGAYATIMAATHISEDQKAAAVKAAVAYKTLLIDGVTIEEHLQQTAEPPVTNNHLDFLKDKVVDQSMLSSTAIDLDKHYLDHVMAKDIAAVVSQMATNGMFLIKTEQYDTVTQLSAIRQYKMTYQDLNGKRHNVTFKLPIVSSDGTILINGIKSRMIKQQVNLPICKIDDRRVSLASSYNKTLVERIGTKAHNFNAFITRYIAQIYKAKVGLDLSYGSVTTSVKLPYDYSSLARSYSSLTMTEPPREEGGEPFQYHFTFDYDKRFADTPATEAITAGGSEVSYLTKQRALEELEKTYGVYCGRSRRNGYTYRMFFGYDNIIRFIGPNRGMTPVGYETSFISLLFNIFEKKVSPPNPLSEWTELKILDKNFPVVFILGFEYGLQRVLDHIKLTYQFVPTGTRFPRTPTTLVVPFADGNLVFDRYPLEKSLVVAGLLKFKTKSYEFAKFNSQDIYYILLQDSGISLNYLKGITDFFKLFIDPITRDVLLRMHEPIEVGRLLLRATEMLTTEESIPSASMRNHRLRGYERFTTTLYNEMARAYAGYSRQRGNRSTYSINPEAVFLRLIQDQTLHIVEEINPVENIKEKHTATYTGGGGRTAQSFVIEDRQYPADGIGILSEASPDNGKVGINTQISANPIIANIRGMFALDSVDPSKLEPSQLLSVPSLLMPCSTNDDGKRNAMISIQLSHHVPSEYSETSRVRTGYETVIAHRSGENFACTAKRDGVVESIDNDLGMIKVRYQTVIPPDLNLKMVSPSPSSRTKFADIAKREFASGHPIYIAQGDGATTLLHLHDIYTFNGAHLQVSDIIPLTDPSVIPMGEYLSDAEREALGQAKHPVLVKLTQVTRSPSDDVDIFKFGTKFTSAAGTFVKQSIICNVTPGEHIKRGDILAYNSGFFERDQFDPKQVTWKHGVMANVVLMEGNDTIEDSDAITADFSKRMATATSHLRTLKIDANTIIKDVKQVGSEVQTTDLLCTLEDADIAAMSESDNNAMLDILTSLNRKAPRAHYHGEIAEIDMLYACPLTKMHPTLAALAKQINARKHTLAQAAAGTTKFSEYAEPAQVPVGTKYHGFEFDEDTVLLMFYISEDIDQGAGDKLVVGNQLKSVTATILEKPISTESGTQVDMLFSARGVNNRIVMSPMIVGFTNRVLQQLEKKVIDLYFG